MSTASFIASQRTDHAIPCALACRALGVAYSTFYAQLNHTPSPTRRRRDGINAAVAASFEASGGTYGSPRVPADLRAEGWRVSKKTVEASMARQGLQGRRPRRRKGLTRPDQGARPAPDLLGRDFSADGVDRKWVGDFKQIHTDQGPVFLATVEDLFSRRLLGFALSDCHPTAELAQAAIHMAVAARGGDVAGVIFHTDKGAQYTSGAFAAACARLGIRQSMGRAGCALDNAAAESFFSTLQHDTNASRGAATYATRLQARRDVAAWIDQWWPCLAWAGIGQRRWRRRRYSQAG